MTTGPTTTGKGSRRDGLHEKRIAKHRPRVTSGLCGPASAAVAINRLTITKYSKFTTRCWICWNALAFRCDSVDGIAGLRSGWLNNRRWQTAISACVGRRCCRPLRKIVCGLYGQVPGQELELSGTRVHAGTGGASPNFIDLETGLYRDANTKDLYDVARLVDQLDNIHFFNRSLVARDCPEPRAFDINTAYACAMGTRKHLGLSFFEPQHVRDCRRDVRHDRRRSRKIP